MKKMDIENILKLQKASSKNISEWVLSHKCFKWAPMCNDIGIDKAYFSRVLNSEKPLFKLELIPAIVKYIEYYGYIHK